MTLFQLMEIFPDLPFEFYTGLKTQDQPGASDDFKVCWYGSAGIDTRLMDYFHPEHSLIGAPVKVFFFTDIDYAMQGNCLGWNGGADVDYGNGGFPERVQSCFKLKDGTTVPALVDLLPLRQTLCIHIRVDDALFEDTMIGLNHKIDVVSYLNGMNAGPGPRKLYDLGADYSFGEPLKNRSVWAEQIEWETHACGFTLAKGFSAIPLSQRLMGEPNWMREVEFCKLVRLPSPDDSLPDPKFTQSDLNVDFLNRTKACSPAELGSSSGGLNWKEVEIRRRTILHRLRNVDTTGFEDLL